MSPTEPMGMPDEYIPTEGYIEDNQQQASTSVTASDSGQNSRRDGRGIHPFLRPTTIGKSVQADLYRFKAQHLDAAGFSETAGQRA
ncbi:hypothetical protein TMatcc_000454 [Talaromyces marneffei ATCC 18224]